MHWSSVVYVWIAASLLVCSTQKQLVEIVGIQGCHSDFLDWLHTLLESISSKGRYYTMTMPMIPPEKCSLLRSPVCGFPTDT